MTKFAKISIFGLVAVVILVASVAMYMVLQTPDDVLDTGATSEIRGGLERQYVLNAEDRGAVCNDGSPAVFFHRDALEEFEDKWVVWFEGGGSCNDAESCLDRWKTQKYLMTSDTTSERAKGEGLLSVDPDKNPDFYGWNHVILNYCSSDFWIGDNNYSDDDITLDFSGKQIVTSIFEDLVNKDVLDVTIDTASEVLVTGSSAGGMGAAHNLNDIQEWLPNVAISGLIDSAWNSGDFETTAYTVEKWEEMKAQRESSQDKNAFRNPVFDSGCTSDKVESSAGCSVLETLQPYWTVPVFIYIDQYDKVLLGTLLDNIGSASRSTKKQLADDRALDIRESLKNIDGVFSPQETLHAPLPNAGFNNILIDGYSFQETLGNWYFDRSGPANVIEE